jgi:hypothetical protein
VRTELPVPRGRVQSVDISQVTRLVPSAIPEQAVRIFKAPLNESIIIINELTKVFSEFYFHEEPS